MLDCKDHLNKTHFSMVKPCKPPCLMVKTPFLMVKSLRTGLPSGISRFIIGIEEENKFRVCRRLPGEKLRARNAQLVPMGRGVAFYRLQIICIYYYII
jgi:hypothetical protein